MASLCLLWFGLVSVIVSAMADYKVEVLPSPRSNLGEGPHWDAATQSLYYIDIYGGSLHRYDYAENRTYNATIDDEPVVSFIVPVEGGVDEFALGMGRRVVVARWDGRSPKAHIVRTVGEVETDAMFKDNRFNDGKADPFGRLYAGTMRLECKGDIFEKRLGNFYVYTKEKQFEQLRKNVGISNGLTWNVTTNKFYYIDSCDLNVKEFNYNPDTGAISDERVVISFLLPDGSKPTFVPDGMTSDAAGFLYVATWGGSRVLKINPTNGKIELEIKMPCSQVTSAAFGGPNLDILFVTTAATERDGPQPAPAGSLFKITGLGAHGQLMTKAHV